MRGQGVRGWAVFIVAVMVWLGPAAGCSSSNDEPAEVTDPGSNRAPTPLPGAALRGERIARLAAVDHWLYLIDVDLSADTVNEIADSAHDLVVLDFIPSESANEDYAMAAVVGQLQTAAHPKLVLAYIDIGQAEEYRSYWREGWEIGDPEWIVSGDPDGWEGNYPVAYWWDEWREIWLDPTDGLIPAVVNVGFDGIYLDWVEAYDDDNVIAAAENDGVNPVQEMVRWVADIAAAARAIEPSFIVIGQNAADLAVDSSDYRATIDAVSQEQVWFDGGADNDPPGDCPLPATEAEVDSSEYVESLTSRCQRTWEEFPDSTLHVSSEWYLSYLIPLQESGLLVFTVDYAEDPDNVAWVLAESHNLGFVPFVGNRALDRFVPVR